MDSALHHDGGRRLAWDGAAGDSRPVALPLGLYAVQLTLNVLWSGYSSGWQMPGAAFIEVVVLWLTILATILAFCVLIVWRPDCVDLAWASFASALIFRYLVSQRIGPSFRARPEATNSRENTCPVCLTFAFAVRTIRDRRVGKLRPVLDDCQSADRSGISRLIEPSIGRELKKPLRVLEVFAAAIPGERPIASLRSGWHGGEPKVAGPEKTFSIIRTSSRDMAMGRDCSSVGRARAPGGHGRFPCSFCRAWSQRRRG